MAISNFLLEKPKRMYQEWLSLMGCTSAYCHFQRTLDRTCKDRILADIHSISLAASTMQGVRIEVEHYLHINVCKMGMLYRKTVPWICPSSTLHSLGLKMNRSIIDMHYSTVIAIPPTLL